MLVLWMLLGVTSGAVGCERQYASERGEELQSRKRCVRIPIRFLFVRFFLPFCSCSSYLKMIMKAIYCKNSTFEEYLYLNCK